MAQNGPHHALIILSDVSWGLFVKKSSSGPLCGASGESSLVFRLASLDWPVTRAPFPDPTRSVQGLKGHGFSRQASRPSQAGSPPASLREMAHTWAGSRYGL